MADELILVIHPTPVTLEANGASIANNAVGQANDDTYSVITDGDGYPDAKFVLAATFGTAPTEGSAIILAARPINIDSTNDAETPEATRLGTPLGSFIVNNVTTTQYIELIVQDVPWEAEYYLHNHNTGQTLSAGWTLKVTPFTYKPAPAA